MSLQRYYAYIAGETIGPLEPASLKRLVAGGRLVATTPVWREGLPDWVAAQTVEELMAAFPQLRQGKMRAKQSRPESAEAVVEPQKMAEKMLGDAPAEAASEASVRLASFRQRMAAQAVDALILGAGFIVILFGFLLWFGYTGQEGDFSTFLSDGGLFSPFAMACNAVVIPYYILCFSKLGGGQSLGYRVVGIRLIREENGRMLGKRRVLLWLLVSVVGFVGFFWYFKDPQRRMLHNIASRSLVVTV